MVSARDAAFSALSKIEKDNSYSNLVLSDMLKHSDLSNQDMLLAHRISKTVLERKITADYNLSLYLTQPLKKLKPQVLTILRMGACQLLFMDKIPVSAAINESVKLTKKHGCAFASGLVNAVLRKVASTGLKLPEKEDTVKYLGVKYSFPEYLCRKFCDYYGVDNAEKIMEASLDSSRIYIRKNTLNDVGLSGVYERSDVTNDCYILKNSGDVTENADFIDGLFHVQDLSSQLCCKILDPQKGETTLDICASPGGKTATMAQLMENQGEIISCDIYEHRLKLIESNVMRLGIDIVKLKQRDGSDKNALLPMADRILCDVPCSGFGVTSKKPEIKYKDHEEVKELPALQLDILENSSRFLKPGGRLVYSTCTLLPEENINVCREFLKKHGDFALVDIDENIKGFRDEKTLTILPFVYNCDGFFVAAFERNV